MTEKMTEKISDKSDNKNTTIRVLAIARLCNPDWVSVPLVGWNHYNSIQSRFDTHLITHIENKNNILNAGIPADKVTFLGSMRVIRTLRQIARLISHRAQHVTENALEIPLYLYLELKIWRLFRHRIKAKEFQIVHRITPLSPVIPSLLARLCHKNGIPFVLGPLNGGLPWPPGSEDIRQKEAEWVSSLRPLKRFLPFYRSTRTHSKAIILASAMAWREMDADCRQHCFYMPENAIDENRFSTHRMAPHIGPLKCVFVGRLVAVKGIEIAIHALLPFLKNGQIVFEIIGDGPIKNTLTDLVKNLDVQNVVHFLGWIDNSKVAEQLALSQIFLFPSIREFGGAVVLEAMMIGLVPVICDYGGPAEFVDESHGFLIPVGKREKIISALSAVLQKLVEMTPQSIFELGQKSRKKTLANFTMNSKLNRTAEIYDWCVSGDADKKPKFLPPEASLQRYIDMGF